MFHRLGAAAVGVLVALTAACGGSSGTAATLAGMVRTPTPAISVPALTTSTGEPVRFDAPANGLALVYFGYTSCPDICPTTLSDLRYALSELGDDASRVELTFITVDPERDTDEVLDGYVASFFDGAATVRITDPAGLQSLADAFGASFSRSVAADGTIEVGHTAFLYALDRSGDLLVQWPFGTTRDELLNDLDTLLKRQEPER